MQNTEILFKKWLDFPLEDSDLTTELQNIKDDSEAIYDRFYRELSFGTAGLRGVIGAGTNRMNIYTVRKATQGLSDMLLEKKKNPSVTISYDSRIKSELFAHEAAVVLASNGIKVYITNRLMPTPVLSFCVRAHKSDAGIMITASHNPAAYNGYKAYGEDGCQMNAEDSAKVLSFAEKTDIFGAKYDFSFEEGLEKGIIEYIDESVYSDYYDKVLSLSINQDVTKTANLNIVYTPLNGTGNEPVRKILRKIGVNNISVVAEQEFPDGNFTTCPYPNPEIREALLLGIELFDKKNADLLIATDPDADRVGIAVRDNDGKAVLMTGNAVGVLLLNYIASQKKENGTLRNDAIACKSIVTTALADRVCQFYNIEMKNVLTGFKYIGEQIRLLEEKGEEDRFLFGYEESYGYLSGSFVRDKDAVIASMLIAEMASYYKTQGKSLFEVYTEIEKQFGVYVNAVDSFAFRGAKGMKKMASIMDELRNNPLREYCGYKTISVSDYLKGVKTSLETGEETKIDLPSSNVLQFDFEKNCKLIVRPSGTEPKIKFYYTVVSDERKKATEICKTFADKAKEIVK